MKTGNNTAQSGFFSFSQGGLIQKKAISQAQVPISQNELDLPNWAGVAEESARGLARWQKRWIRRSPCDSQKGSLDPLERVGSN